MSGLLHGTGTPVPSPEASAVLDRLAAPAGSTSPSPRLLLVFAHPDDEVLAIGGRMARLSASRLLTVTDGAPLNGQDAAHHGFASLQAYRDARTGELDRAFTKAGLLPFAPMRTPLEWTPVADQTTPLHLVRLTQALAVAIHQLRPEAVLTHPYEGGHPDHDACAFAVHTAVRMLQRGSAPLGPASVYTPVIAEAAFYHAGPAGMQTGRFLPSPEPVAERRCPLSPKEQRMKRDLLDCFPSQRETLQQFQTEYELYREAPTYDFTQPPHAGELLYEHFGWGFTGAQFRSLAAEATRQLEGSLAGDLPYLTA